MELEEEQRVEAEAPILGQHAEQQQARLIDNPAPTEQPDEPERKQTAVGALERLIDVGNRDSAGDWPSVHFGAHRAAWIEDLLQFFGELAELFGRRRHEAPVPFPRAAVNLAQPLDLALELSQMERSDENAVAIAYAGGELRDSRRHVGVDRIEPREQILHLLVSSRFDICGVCRRVVRHHHHRIALETFDEQPRAFIE